MDDDFEQRLNRLERWRVFHANAGSDPRRAYVVNLWPTAEKLWAYLRNARAKLVSTGAVVLHPNGDVLIDPPVFGQTIERDMHAAQTPPKAAAVPASRAPKATARRKTTAAAL
jgi:hypothetical protein